VQQQEGRGDALEAQFQLRRQPTVHGGGGRGSQRRRLGRRGAREVDEHAVRLRVDHAPAGGAGTQRPRARQAVDGVHRAAAGLGAQRQARLRQLHAGQRRGLGAGEAIGRVRHRFQHKLPHGEHRAQRPVAVADRRRQLLARSRASHDEGLQQAGEQAAADL